MGAIHPLFDQILARVAAADKTTDCDLRGFMMQHLNEFFRECPAEQLVSFRDKLQETEDYEWCADLQSLISHSSVQA